MAKRGRPPGKTYPHTITVGLNDEQHEWIERMAEVMDVSVAEAARVVIAGTMNEMKGKARSNG